MLGLPLLGSYPSDESLTYVATQQDATIHHVYHVGTWGTLRLGTKLSSPECILSLLAFRVSLPRRILDRPPALPHIRISVYPLQIYKPSVT
jgi:hypothetical protein